MRMSEREDEVGQLRSRASADVVRRYEAYRGLLLRLLTRNFGVPAGDAESLVYETFLACEMVGRVANVEAWLIAGATEMAKAHLRTPGRAPSPPSLRDALTVLPEHARELLRLRFEEGLSYPEIAAVLGMSVDAVERIAAKALARVRKMQR